MAESTDLIAKRASLKAIEASINLHMKRAEELAAEYQNLGAEIEALEAAKTVVGS